MKSVKLNGIQTAAGSEMLTGEELVNKVVELDGEPLEVVVEACGYLPSGNDHDAVDQFYRRLSNHAHLYIKAIEARRRSSLGCEASTPACTPLLLKRYAGRELLLMVHDLDPGLRPEPPWESISAVVMRCGYVALSQDAKAEADFYSFRRAFLEAEREQDESIAELPNEKPAAARILELASCIRGASIETCCIEGIRISYSGCGDDGEVDRIEYLFGAQSSQCEPEALCLPPAQIDYGGIERSLDEYEDMLRDDAFAIIYNSHPSCFNHQGAMGYLLIDTQQPAIHGIHMQSATEEENDSTEQQVSPYFITHMEDTDQYR